MSLCLFSVCAPCLGQRVEVWPAPRVTMPGEVDSNSPAFWVNGELHVINSTGAGPLLSRGLHQFRLGASTMATINRAQRDWPTWIEAVWVDGSGTILAWYHQEHEYVCGPQRPAMPRIGAMLSYDNGRTFWDQGIILSSGDPMDCTSRNGYFAGGHGDFSVVLDQQQRFFYFLFTNYAGPLETQGVVVARMSYDDRFHPLNHVWKYHAGKWNQPGVGGRTTPIFPAVVSWQRRRTDSFWGPSVHWNQYLGRYVMLLNRSCCDTGWPQEGIYTSFGADLSKPESWSEPTKLMDGVFWYPQVLGIGPQQTDSVAGRRARLYVFGESRWELVFHRTDRAVPSLPVSPEEDQ